MRKDFDGWNREKKRMNNRPTTPFYHEREIWWCALGINIGFEQDGTGTNYDRPVLIIRGFNPHVFFGVALTGRKKRGKYYLPIGEIEGRQASVILSQVRLIDSKRLVRKMSTLEEDTFKEVRISIARILFGE